MTIEAETSYGRLRGTESTGIKMFRGVRFARPPRGVLRFRPPLPPEPWTGSRDATEWGPAAPQVSLPYFSWINAAARTPDEDCLSLNLWTPGLDAARRPVMVFIHGGGFMVGSGATPIYDGRDLARRGDLVLISINYRLGALGFTNLRGLFGEEFADSSNLGVRDQIAALEWVRDNVERFGGDPGKVTVFGQSAGAMSIAALLSAPRARPLFQRAILQSGAADHVRAADEADEIARAFVGALGGPPASLSALGRIPLGQILSAQTQVLASFSDTVRLMAFTPVVDGDLIPEQPIDAVRRGELAHVPLLLGATLDEWKLFRLFDEGVLPMSRQGLLERFDSVLSATLPRAPEAARAAQDFRIAMHGRSAARSHGGVWSAFQSARVFHYPATRLAEAQEDGGGRAYNYLFTWRPPALRRALGACHALDIPFVFGATQHPLARPFTGLSNAAGRLSRRMQHAFIEFAHGREPGHERLPEWPIYRRARRATMIFGRSCELSEAPLELERRLLESWHGPAHGGALSERAELETRAAAIRQGEALSRSRAPAPGATPPSGRDPRIRPDTTFA